MDTAVNASIKNFLPSISVILPVYNSASFLKEAIDSILKQTFTDFELLIYDDASADGSNKIIEQYDDKRIIHTRLKEHAGLVKLLNLGLLKAKGKYVARMDADDISAPTRLQEQFIFLEDNPEIGMCGTWYENFEGLSGIYQSPLSPQEIQYSLFFGTPFGHPTVMMKKELFDKYLLRYQEEFFAAEDYDLFERASLHFDLANVPKVLLKYRKHATQITSTNWQKQYQTVGIIQSRRLLRVFNNCDEKDKTWLENYFSETSTVSKKWFDEIDFYKEKLIAENKSNSVYDEPVFVKAINNLFTEEKTKKNIYNHCFRKFYNQQRFNLSLLVSFFKDQNKPYKRLGSKLTFLFMIKCLFHYRKKSLLPV